MANGTSFVKIVDVIAVWIPRKLFENSDISTRGSQQSSDNTTQHVRK